MEQLKQKLKDLASTWWAKLAALIALLAGFIALLLKSKDDEIAELRAQIELAQTQKEADLLDTQIRQRLLTADDADSKIRDLNSALKELEKKRKSLPDDNPEDYWKKN